QFARQRRSRDHRREAADDGAAHVHPRIPVLAVAEQADALVAERAHGGECAAEPDRQAAAQLGRDDGGAGGEPHDEPDQKRAGEVDRERARGEGAAACLQRALQDVARQRAEDAAEGDVGDHAHIINYLSPMPRLAVAQIRPSKGDYAANLQKIGGVLAEIAKHDPPVDLVIFPETATSGYYVEGGVRDVAVTAGTLFRDLTIEHEAAGAPPLDVAVGLYEVFQNHFYNSCLYASLGNASPENASSRILHVHRKVFLPTYGVFDEERFV